ncbi:MAG TPA: HIRAN domain-containing protein [Longimicrobium sp.]|jgi:hypothetical protein|uniref:HIRAN domain-containing protein n=1 Tax=Longimicrobium sp. TaxID=2029185 RepID=UPI002EDAF3BE
MIPPLPQDQPATFETFVHGTIFGDRTALAAGLREGDELVLIPDPPMEDDPNVWVHVSSGDVVGHLPPDINQWMATWLLRGGSARATVLKAHGQDVPSYKRLEVQIQCAGPDA